MLVQTTIAGQALLDASPLNTLVTSVRLGSSFGYQLSLYPAGLTGTQVYLHTDTISPIPGSNNSIKYQFVLDDLVGNFTFGEVAFYVGTTLLAVGVLSSLVSKVKEDSRSAGNKVKIEGYIDLGTDVRFSFGDINLSNSKDLIPRIPNVDLLPQIDASVHSLMSVYSDNNVQPFMCYSDGVGRWAIENKSRIYDSGQVILIGSRGMTGFLINEGVDLTNTDTTNLVVQFTDGKGRSICRRIVNYQLTAEEKGEIEWSTPIVENLPKIGDSFIILGQDKPYSSLPVGTSDGDILVWDSEDRVYRPLPTALVPTGYVLTRDTSLDLGVKWAPAASGSGSQSITIIQKPESIYFANVADGYSYLIFSHTLRGPNYILDENYITSPIGWWANLANKTSFDLEVIGTVEVKPGFLALVVPGGNATIIKISGNRYHLFGDLAPVTL